MGNDDGELITEDHSEISDPGRNEIPEAGNKSSVQNPKSSTRSLHLSIIHFLSIIR